MTETVLREILTTRFDGVLKSGKHEEDGEACALELLSAAHGLPWTDDPRSVRSFDLRRINDISVPDSLRAELMLPVLVAYDGSLDWPPDRQKQVVTRIAVMTVNRLIAELPWLPTEIADMCRSAKDLTQARAAVSAAETATWRAVTIAESWRAATTARTAQRAAAAAAAAHRAAETAATDAARELVFRATCQLWLDAVQSASAPI